MRLHFLFAVVGLQILIFQFLSVRFLRSIPGYVLGDSLLPDEVKAAVEAYRRGVGSRSYAAGLALLIAMTLFVYVIPFGGVLPGALCITAASVLSSGFFVWTYLRARSAADRITERLPDSGIRVASLERRALGHYYNVAWELAPFVLLAISAALLIWAMPNLSQPYPTHFGQDGIPDSWGEGTGRFLFLVLLQGLTALGLLLLTFRVLRSRACLSPKASVAARRSDAERRISEGARRRELQYFMGAKVAVALKFTLILFVKVETALGVHLPWWAANSPWAVSGFLLLAFVLYIVQTARGPR